jgi:hypothetical protein
MRLLIDFHWVIDFFSSSIVFVLDWLNLCGRTYSRLDRLSSSVGSCAATVRSVLMKTFTDTDHGLAQRAAHSPQRDVPF